MNLEEFTEQIQKVADQYAERYEVEYTEDWLVMKLQEELGEMAQAHLIASGRTRRKPETPEKAKSALAHELADILCYVLLFAKHLDIDIEQAVEEKWFKHLRDS